MILHSSHHQRRCYARVTIENRWSRNILVLQIDANLPFHRLVEHYALPATTTPMGIAEFRHLENLPVGRQGSLSTIEDIEAEKLRTAEDSPA